MRSPRRVVQTRPWASSGRCPHIAVERQMQEPAGIAVVLIHGRCEIQRGCDLGAQAVGSQDGRRLVESRGGIDQVSQSVPMM